MSKEKIKKSDSGTISGRGERERTKWREKRAEKEKIRNKTLAEEEFVRKRGELQKKDYRRRHDGFEKVLADAEALQKDVESVISDYRQSRNRIKFQLSTDSNNFVETQQFEKAQLMQVTDQIRISESQLATMNFELSKTTKISNEFLRDSSQKWYVRWWKCLY
uniref:Uncharacterized protein n=1 Tax=Caenorhabditis japonica TaxID=281687 RepID=A0A8R1HY41_CAEJA